MIKKTNAVRELDQHKIPYSTKEYEVDESDLSAVHVALVTNTRPWTEYLKLFLS